MDEKQILIVEDRRITAAHLKANIEQCGYKCVCIVSSGEEAIRKAKELKPDLILMDIMLEGEMDGIQAAAMIRKQLAIPIVFLTAYTDDSIVQRAKETEPFGYLIKPFRTEELRTTIEVALHKHQMELRLRDTERRLELSLEASNTGLWEYNFQTGKALYDRSSMEMYGYEAHEIENNLTFWGATVHPDDLRSIRKSFNAHVKGKTPSFENEHRIRTKSGEWRWNLSRGKVVEFDDYGNPVKIIGTNCDVTSRKQMEMEVAASQQRLAHLLSSSPTIIYTCIPNSNKKITFISDNLRYQLGYEPSHVVESPSFWADHVHPDDIDRVLDDWHGLVDTDDHVVEYRLLHDNGGYRWIQDQFKLIRDQHGEPFEVIGSWIDITERKWAEEELERNKRNLENTVRERTAVLITTNEELKREINERKQTEAALRKSESRFKKIFKMSPEALALASLHDGRIVEVNAGFTKITGWSKEEVIGKMFSEVGIWNDPDDYNKLLSVLIENGEMNNWEVIFRLKIGVTRTGLVSASVVDIYGMQHLLIMVKDITELKQAQDALVKSEQKYRNLFESAQDAIFLIQHQTIVQCNTKALQMFQCTDNDMVGRSLLHFSPEIQPDDIRSDRKFIEIEESALNGVNQSFEWLYLTKERTPFQTEVTLSLVDSLDGTFLLAIVRDVTVKKRAETELKTRANELELLNRIGLLVSTELTTEVIGSNVCKNLIRDLDIDLAILFVRSGQDLIPTGHATRNWLFSEEGIHNHKIGECLCGIAAAEGQIVYSPDLYEDPRCTWDECKKAGLKSLAAIPLNAGRETLGVLCLASFAEKNFSVQDAFFIALAHQITTGVQNAQLYSQIQTYVKELEDKINELEHAERQTKKLEDQLLHSQKMEAVGTLAGGIAHDFNNLLQVIQGSSDMALFNMNPDDPGYQEIKELKDTIRNASELTQGLLTFSRKVQSRVRPVRIDEEIRFISKMLNRTLPKMIPVELRIADDIKVIDADPSQLQQVVMNLAVNARDAMPEGGRLVIEATNWEQSDNSMESDLGIPTGQYVKLSISDTGCGMGQETISKVFDPFFTTKNPGQGTGLGLSIVYGIVKSHRAHIHCYSEPGVGTTFNLYFPVSSEESVVGSETQTDLPAGHGENLLLVDDDQSIVNVGRKILTNFGYRVLSASNGVEAIDLYNEKKDSIDLVVLDLIMPLMGGRECLARILNVNPKAKVVIASGYSADGRLESVLDEGAQAVISKPYEARQILQTVRQVLDSG